eukprot:6630285-Prymnesium_polylepis.2
MEGWHSLTKDFTLSGQGHTAVVVGDRPIEAQVVDCRMSLWSGELHILVFVAFVLEKVCELILSRTGHKHVGPTPAWHP